MTRQDTARHSRDSLTDTLADLKIKYILRPGKTTFPRFFMHKGLHIFNFRKGVNKNTVEDDIKGGAVIVIFSLTRYSPPYKEPMAGTVGSGKGQVLRPVLLLARRTPVFTKSL